MNKLINTTLLEFQKLMAYLNASKLLSYVLAITIFAVFAEFVVSRQLTPFQPELLEGYNNIIFEGFISTIAISTVSLLGSVVLGFVLYLLTVSKIKFFEAFTDVFTEIVYGTPLLVMIIVMSFMIGPAFGTFNRSLMGTLGLIIYITPYMTNIYKSAFSSIGNDQYMAMKLFGFTSYQRYRYIIIPQVVRILMPPMMNNFSLIIKGSALLNVISFRELYSAISVVQSQSFGYVEGYMLMWILYIAITIPLSQLTKYVERRWST
jgi:polar amino acid transport system permease protein